MVKSESGLITKVKKNKGYESISRDMAQNYELSFQAVGLLTYLETLNENFKIHKTMLYKQREKNKRTMVENMWDELVFHGYMIQFKEDTKSTYSYKYFFSANGLTKDDCLDIIESMKSLNYKLYFSKKQMEDLNIDSADDYFKFLKGESELVPSIKSNKTKSLPKPVKDKTNGQDRLVKDSQESTSVENQQWRSDNVSTSVENQQWSEPVLIHHSGETATNRFSTKGLEEEEEELININRRELLKDDKLKEVYDIFLECGFGEDDAMSILSEIDKDRRLLDNKLIADQLYWVVEKSQEESIYDLPKYFLNGIRKKAGTKNLSLSQNMKDNQIRNAGILFDEDDEEDIPLFNWLEDQQ